MEFSDIKVRYKQIPGFKDYYITEDGNVYSTRLRGNGTIPRLHKLVPKNPGRADKYFNIVLCDQDGEHTRSIHRLVAENFVDGYFDGAVVNHIDGNNRNNNASNLEWTTIKDNVHKSYITSGIGAKRNYKIWTLFDPKHHAIGEFYSWKSMVDYIHANNINAAPYQLVKNGYSRGYTVKKGIPAIKNCNDYPKGVH